MPFLAMRRGRGRAAPALDDGVEEWSFATLAREADLVRRRLAALGIGPRDCVAVYGEVDAPFVAALHGIWGAGASTAPLHHRWTETELRRALRILAPALVLVGRVPEDPPGDAWLADAKQAWRLGAADPLDLPPLSSVSPARSPAAGPPSEEVAEAARLLTSGTTGTPSPVRITVANLKASARAARDRLSLSSSDVWLCSLSPAHVGGLALLSRAAMVGSKVILAGSFQAEAFRRLLSRDAFTHASLVPTMLHEILEAAPGRPAPASLRCLLIGGARAGAELVDRALSAGYPIALTYGLTQATSQVATAPPELVRRKPGTVGPPLAGVDVETGPKGTEGEIRVRGATVAPGCAGEDGWLRTGDLGHFDEEGHLWVTGKVTDRIVTGGVNVDPAEVEAALTRHPAVAQAGVVGVPDVKWGERVAAGVVLRAGAALTAEELLAAVATELSAPKRPRMIRFLEALPLNANGKLDRNRLRAWLE